MQRHAGRRRGGHSLPARRHTRTLTATTVAIGMIVPTAALGQDSDPTDPAFIATLDQALVAGTVTPPGTEIDDLQTDLLLYDDLAYEYEDVTADNLVVDYFKDGRWGEVQNPTRDYRPRADVRVVRDAQGVPHIYGDTDEAGAFGAGYVSAEDRLVTLEALRALGRAETFELLANNEAWLMDGELVRLYGYTEEEFQAQLDRLPEVYGQEGADLKALAENFAQGINFFLVQMQQGRVPVPASLADLLPPNDVAPYRATDIVAIVSIVRALFGAGGGGELGSAARWLDLVDAYGPELGPVVYEDFRQRFQLDGPVHTTNSFPYLQPQVDGPTEGNAMQFGAGNSGIQGLLEELGSIVPGTLTAAADDLRVLDELARPKWDLLQVHAGDRPVIDLSGAGEAALSNWIAVGGSRTASGHPIVIGGPQTGYLANQILTENVLHTPTIHASGASFPGLSLAVIGRNGRAAWTATAGGSDMIDTYLNVLCDPDGGTITEEEVHYLYDEDGDGEHECIPMDVRLHREATSLPGGELLPAIYAERTIQGPVVARGRFGDIAVAVSRKRSTYMKELDPGISILRMNRGVDTAQGFVDAFSAGHNLSTNWVFASDDEIAYFHGGLYPYRPDDIHPDFPVWGTGEWEWELAPEGSFDRDAYFPGSMHPHEMNPARDYIVSWNNRTATDWGSCDSCWGYSAVYRADLLEDQVLSDGEAGRKITPARITSLMEHAGLSDLRGSHNLDGILEVLAAGTPPSDRAAQMRDILAAWHAPGGPDGSYAWSATRRDADRDGEYEDAAAAAIMDAWWSPVISAVFDPALGRGVGGVSRQGFHNAPGPVGSAFQGGFYGQLRTDLDQVLGRTILSPTSQIYCGSTALGTDGTLASCAAALWASLDATGDQLAADQGSEDPAAWGVDEDAERIQFTFVAPVPPPFQNNDQLPSMHWVNRPTTQVIAQFGDAGTPVPTPAPSPAPEPEPLPATGGGLAALGLVAAAAVVARRRRP